MFDRRPLAGPENRVAEIVGRHGDLLLRVARGYSLCADDAQDALQRALEIYMRRVESLDPATELAWLKVVVKHEALAVRRGRAGVASEEVNLDALPAVAQRSVEERLESSERVERSAEVMRRLKRDEARALMLKAEGLSYNEIGERLGWTYTKVNRCITEGRRRFMKLYAELETGAECERLAPVVAALAAGTASPEALLELRPHLRNCAGCRATVRALHASRLRRVTAFAPIAALVAPARAFVERFRGSPGEPRVEDLETLERAEKVDELFRRIGGGESALQPVAPSVVEGVRRASSARLNLRGWIEGALQRLQSSEVAMGVHAATSGGGGRITSLAAIIGVCVSGVGAVTYCVATALLPDPKPAVRSEAKAAAGKRKPAAADHKRRLARLPAPASQSAVAAATPAPVKRVARTPRRSSTPAPASVTPASHEQAPVSPAHAATQDFSFEQSAAAPASAPSQPAAAPASGGGEFEP